ncbi:MAG: hypothetical protein AAGA55_07295 [Planctomycetota bacterium]
MVAAMELDPSETGPVVQLLREPGRTLDTLEALQKLVLIPTPLWRDVSRLTSGEQDQAIRLSATAVVSRFGTRESIETLVILAADPDGDVARQARRELRDLTGLGGGQTPWDADRWTEWGKLAATWNDREWARVLITSQTQAARIADSNRRAARESTVELYRRLHIELDADGRSTLLAELIDDERAWLRDLGFELAGRDLSARTALNEQVALAAASQLTGGDPATRTQAAILIGRLVPPDAMLLLTSALRAEDEPGPAEPMLLGIARWPNPDAADAVLGWLERDDAPLGAACTAIWSLALGGYLDPPQRAARTLAVLRDRPLDRIGLPGMRTLTLLGGDPDLDRIVRIIEDQEHPMRSDAAEALTETRDGLTRLLGRKPDPRLFPTLARGITHHDLSVAGFARIAGLPAIEESAMEHALLTHASRLTAAELNEAAEAAGLDDQLAAQVLDRLMVADPGSDIRIARGLLTLAMTRNRLGDHAAASEALGLIGDSPLPEPDQTNRRTLRLQLAITDEDPNLAFAIPDITPGEWITALQWARSAPAVRGVIADRLLVSRPEGFTPEQTALLESWASGVRPEKAVDATNADQPPEAGSGSESASDVQHSGGTPHE